MNNISENKLNNFVKEKKIKNILIITGKKSFKFSGFKKLTIYKNFKSIIKIFYKKKRIPEINELNFLIKKINNVSPDLIIALGGGCAIDYAKLANSLHNIINLKNKILNKRLKLNSRKTKILAIPTTAGSGAEVTRFSVIYINKKKYSIEDNLLRPNFFSLIPKLVINSPRIVKAASGFDAISQAAEAIFSKKANLRSLKYSSKSLRISTKNFLGFVNSSSLYNAASMLKAANFSGMAINIAKTNAPHALSYLFTSKYSVPHGIAVSLFFIEIFNLYYSTALKTKNVNLIKKFHLFFRLIKKKNISEFNNFFKKLLSKSKIQKDIDKFLKNVKYQKNFNLFINSSRLKNSPIKIYKKDVTRLYLNKFNI